MDGTNPAMRNYEEIVIVIFIVLYRMFYTFVYFIENSAIKINVFIIKNITITMNLWLFSIHTSLSLNISTQGHSYLSYLHML